MVNKQTLLVVLLVFAIVFSVASVLLTLSLDNFKPAKVFSPSEGQEVVSGTSAGGIGLVIEPSRGGIAP